MPRPSPIALSRLTGGVNRFAREARPNQLVDGVDVIADDGELRRRPAWRSVAMAPPHMLPWGQLRLFEEDFDTAAITELVDHLPAGFNTRFFYLGNPYQQFDGFWWPGLEDQGSYSEHLQLYLEYWDGSDWVELPGWLDRTQARNGDDVFSLERQEGHASWHTRSFADDWAFGSPTEGLPGAYYIRASLETLDGTEIVVHDGACEYPGVRIFKLEPVNGLFSVRVSGRQALIVGSDEKRRGSSPNPGAQVAAIRSTYGRSRPQVLVEDEGAGIWATGTWPQNTVNGAPVGPAPGSYGQANALLEGRGIGFSWGLNAFRGGVVVREVTIDTVVSNFELETDDLPVSGAEALGVYDGLRLRCTVNGSGSGTLVGDEVEIARSEDLTLYLSVAFASGDPDDQNEFEIRLPGAMCRFNGYLPEFEVTFNDGDSAEFNGYDNLANPNDIQGLSLGEHVHWQFGRELRWTTPSGNRWSATVDLETGHLILTNGQGQTFFWDGDRLRRFEVEDFDSIVSRFYSGRLREEGEDTDRAEAQAKAVLGGMIPEGRYLTLYQNRLIVAGIRGEPLTVRHSAPFHVRVWPLVYDALVRDQEEDPISGMASLYDRLVVFTPTALHEALPPGEDGRLNFRVVTQGVGFTSHWGVAKVPMAGGHALVGPGPDGVYAYNGSEPQPVLDDWRRLLPGGVNRNALNRAVGVCLPQRSWYCLAVAAAGSTELNRILVWDYGENVWWVWTAPYGVSAMSADTDSTGRERWLLGTDDGHVMTLQEGEDDEGEDIEGRARSAWQQPGRAREMSLTAVLVTAQDMGDGSLADLTVTTHLARRKEAEHTESMPVDTEATRYGSSSWQDDNSVRWATKGYKTQRVNLPCGTRDHQMAVEFYGRAQWRVAEVEVLARPLGRRGR